MMKPLVRPLRAPICKSWTRIEPVNRAERFGVRREVKRHAALLYRVRARLSFTRFDARPATKAVSPLRSRLRDASTWQAATALQNYGLLSGK